MYKAGDTVYFQSYVRYMKSGPRKVEKVGRKWVYLENGLKFQVDKDLIDGGGYCSPGRVWKDEAELTLHTERKRLFSLIREGTLDHSVTLEDLVKAIALLRIKI